MKTRLLIVTTTILLVAAACSGDDTSTTDTSEQQSGSTTSTSVDGRVIDDVDINPGDFTNPTQVTNSLYPVSEVTYAVMLGEDEGEPLRVEVALTPDVKTIEWADSSTETVVSQFIGLIDGQLTEVAYDWFAQDDAGNVWYFGEDVFNYEAGVVANMDGTWIAGEDGPPGMIMPADPRVGDIYHPENIPDLVYEEDLVVSTSETVEGPSGPIEGAMLVQETVEGTIEEKYWAPGYGEFHAIVPGTEDVKVVFALPNDAQAEPVPPELRDLQQGAAEAYDQAVGEDWEALTAAFADLQSDWETYDPGSRSVLPEAFVSAVDQALTALDTATTDHDPEAAAEAAVALELGVVDVMMTHGDPEDVQRIGALSRRLELEATAEDPGAAANTVAMIASLWARGSGSVSDPSGIDEAVETLESAAADEDFAALVEGAIALRDRLPAAG
ncbi:MAG: hypothetical protein JJLCMIEE_01707 [Acidimicrobiales bacterium]|nr:hypothetical protein [Acidimicrobiales bacterium]